MSTTETQAATSKTTPEMTPAVAAQDGSQNGSQDGSVAAGEALETIQSDGQLNGASLEGESAVSDTISDEATSLSDGSGEGAENSTDATTAEHGDASLEIDQRRAKQLLDRAILLSERGDLAGAILAARQAVALVPQEPSSYSMLGLLHERAGDLEKAIAAYEKVLQLAPHSTLERDSLDRLKSTLESENSSVVFHFDDNELFEEPPALPVAPPATQPAEPVVDNPIAAASPAPASAKEASSVAIPPVAGVTGVVGVTAPASKRQDSNALPLSVSATPLNVDPLNPATTATTARPLSGPPSIVPMTMPAMAQRPSFHLLMRQPSFYFKGAPVVAATTLGLLFMGWAQGVSQNKYLEEMPPGPAPTAQTEVLVPSQGASTGAPPSNASTTTVPTPAPGVMTSGGGGIFGTSNTNNPAAPSAPTSNTTGANSGGTVSSGSAARTTTGGRVAGGASAPASGSTGVQPLPPSSANPVIPQPRTGQTSGAAPGGPATLDTLPPLQPRRQGQETVRPSAPGAPAVAPPSNSGGNTSGNSSGGGLFNPASSPRGYIRIDPVRPSNPTRPVARPANEARAAENAASRAGAAGRTDDAVANLNRSIERQPTGYVYQRRAMAFMEQGDYARAADDFQSAISAYQDQIRQNQNVEDARNGIQACRSGLNAIAARTGR